MIFLLKLRNNGTDDYCKLYAKPSDLILSISVLFKSFPFLSKTLLIISVTKKKKVTVTTTMIMMQLQWWWWWWWWWWQLWWYIGEGLRRSGSEPLPNPSTILPCSAGLDEFGLCILCAVSWKKWKKCVASWPRSLFSPVAVEVNV